MLRLFSPVRLVVAGLLVAAVAFALWILPTESYIFLPNEAHPVAPLVEVEGGKDPKDGGIYYVDVRVRKATLAERLIPGLREGATVVPAEQVRPPGVTEDGAATRRAGGDADVSACRGGRRSARARPQGRRHADRRAGRVRRSRGTCLRQAACGRLDHERRREAGQRPSRPPKRASARPARGRRCSWS